MTNISPLLQTMIEKQSPSNNNVQQPKIDLTSKPDTVEISSKNKKVGKYVGMGLAAAATIAGAIFLLTKGKTCLLEFNAKKAQKYAENIQAEAEKIKNEVIELFNNGGQKNGVKVAEIENDIMTEFAQDGKTILRESKFYNAGALKISNYQKNREDIYVFYDKDGKLSRYLKDYKEDANGGFECKKALGFEFGKLSEYAKGYKEDANSGYECKKELDFEDGKLSRYYKDMKADENGSFECKKVLNFEDGKLHKCIKGVKADVPETDDEFDEFDEFID